MFLVGRHGCVFGRHSFEVLAGEFDEVFGVGSDDFLAVVFKDGRQVCGNHDLLGGENSHFANVGHLSKLQIITISNLMK